MKAAGTLKSWKFTFLPSILSSLLDELQTRTDISASTIKNGLMLLKDLVLSHEECVLDKIADILLAVLRCESKPEVSADDQLEIDYEVDAALEILKKEVSAWRLLRGVAVVLDAPGPVDHRVCFEILTKAIVDGSAELPDLAASLSGSISTSADDVWNWERVIGHLAEGLDSRQAATRKSAFDCAYAMCNRFGESLSTRLYEEVGVRSGKTRETVIKGMMERRFR
ncbi:hypothetical protein HDU76_003609 [Blyttiomyces sp. JEL0837]|nr:hypothetical protein HDU76_003609 [Blyttiomyces sp. JEL0837]